MQTLRRLSSSASGLPLFLLLTAVAVVMTGAVTVFADPAWWQSRGVTNGAAADNFAPANLGQAKNMAVQALAEMNDKLAPIGGAGFTQSDLFPAPPPGPGLSGYTAATWQAYVDGNYAPLNLGQLKNLSYRFYDRLRAIGYTAAPVNPAHSKGYPWTETTADDDNRAIANLGQLKNVFSFDLSQFPVARVGADGDGLPDAWELANFGHLGVDPYADDDGDGLTNLQEWQQGTDPHDYYNGQTPALNIISGNNQSARGSLFLAQALKVKVTNQSGQALFNAPVGFQIGISGGHLASTKGGATANSLVMRTDASGAASVWLALPASAANGVSVAASAGTPPHAAAVSFGASVLPLNTSVAPPSETIGRLVQANRVSILWDPSPSDGVTGYEIELSMDAGETWQVVGSTPADVYHFVDANAPDDALTAQYRVTTLRGN